MLSKTHTKYIQSLSHKKFRDEYGVFVAESPKVVIDLLRSNRFTCTEVLALPGWLDANADLLAAFTHTTIHTLEAFELDKISSLVTAHDVVAIFKKKENPVMPDCTGKVTLVLDTIQDPGNLGTIIRIADWFAIENIICSATCADMYNSKVVQSTMGSLGRVHIFYTDLTGWLRQNSHINVFSASLEGRDIHTLGKVQEGIIIIGNEAHGVSDAVMAFVAEKITIPRKGYAESLNAAVATGIILASITYRN
jgi:RNA methyltransferase, TrmH family